MTTSLPLQPRRRHLPAAERERQIIEAATAFFAEHGFEGQTRELAKTMGITHSAIFRYFPTKEALIDKVYESVYLSRWNPDWAGLVIDRTRPLEDRLIQFYREYSERIFRYDWVRIFVFAGLKSYDLNSKYLDIVRSTLILPVCEEMRHHLRLPAPALRLIADREEEAVWALHGQVFYIAIRKFVYNQTISGDISTIVADDVRGFMRSASQLFLDIAKSEMDRDQSP